MFEVKNKFKNDIVDRIDSLKLELMNVSNKTREIQLTILINQLEYELDSF